MGYRTSTKRCTTQRRLQAPLGGGGVQSDPARGWTRYDTTTRIELACRCGSLTETRSRSLDSENLIVGLQFVNTAL